MRRNVLILSCMTLLAPVALLAPLAAHSQSAPELPAGTRVNVIIPDSVRQSPFLARARSLTGTVARATSDTLYLQVGTPDTLRIARSSMRRLYVSRGVSRSRSALQQAIFAGAAFMLTVQGPPNNRTNFRDALAYGAAGLGVGAIVGTLFPYEHWRRVR